MLRIWRLADLVHVCNILLYDVLRRPAEELRHTGTLGVLFANRLYATVPCAQLFVAHCNFFVTKGRRRR